MTNNAELQSVGKRNYVPCFLVTQSTVSICTLVVGHQCLRRAHRFASTGYYVCAEVMGESSWFNPQSVMCYAVTFHAFGSPRSLQDLPC